MAQFTKILKDNIYERYLKNIDSHRIFLAIILCYMTYCFLRLPILSIGDSDTWYHLNGGRYFFQHHQIPKNGFFSFLAQSREWPNYYWLFQVLLYSIYHVTYYYGLIILKTVLYLSTMFLILGLLFKDVKDEKNKIYFFLIFIILSIGVLDRYLVVLRPHIFSYLFIPLFIYLLEIKNRWVVLLPLLTILWVNIHGIEYPVILLITMSYLIEYLFMRIKIKSTISRDEYFYLLPLILCLLAIFVNPYGFKILNAPFNFADNQDQFIAELRHIKFNEFFNFSFYPFSNFIWSGINFLILLIFLSLIKGLWNKKIRISHFLMFAGGTVLLTQALRFRHEAILLGLPIIKYNPLIPILKENPISKRIRFTTLFMLTFSFVLLFHNLFYLLGRYPFSYRQFPQGTLNFLNNLGVSGTILNSPNVGGYLQWELSPKYKIAMDLETILFSDKDFFYVINALNSKEGLNSFSERHHPDFILNGRDIKNFKDIIKSFPEYKLVFFDMTSVLYVSNISLPEIANRYEIKDIDPYKIEEEDIDKLDETRISPILSELKKMQLISPDDMLINLQLGRMYNKTNEKKNALLCSDNIINNFPEMVTGYVLKGDILKQCGDLDKSIFFYKKALKSQFISDEPRILKSLALTYSKSGDDKNAYNYMKKAVQVYSTDVTYKDLWQLANMALKTGRINEGLKLLDFALVKTPSEDKDFVDRISEEIKQTNDLITGSNLKKNKFN
jgi:hypothetical protein